MWDRAALLNWLATLLYAASALLVVYGAWHFVGHQPVFLLREVWITRPPVHVSAEEIGALVRREVRGNFFAFDLAAGRAEFEKLAWVRTARLRRHWPDRLEVTLEEHVPLARWGNLALVNTRGEVFEAAYDGVLPVFMGPPGSAKEIAIQYEYFRRTLAGIDKTPLQVHVSARRAWQIQLADGPTLQLGREQVEARLARFVAAYEHTLGRLDRHIGYVDLRYANGFAVRVPELPIKETAPKKRDGAA
jgi:cell division protein FtsQ